MGLPRARAGVGVAATTDGRATMALVGAEIVVVAAAAVVIAAAAAALVVVPCEWLR